MSARGLSADMQMTEGEESSRHPHCDVPLAGKKRYWRFVLDD